MHQCKANSEEKRNVVFVKATVARPLLSSALNCITRFTALSRGFLRKYLWPCTGIFFDFSQVEPSQVFRKRNGALTCDRQFTLHA